MTDDWIRNTQFGRDLAAYQARREAERPRPEQDIPTAEDASIASFGSVSRTPARTRRPRSGSSTGRGRR